MSDPMWDKLDKQAEIITGLQHELAVTKAQIQAMDERIDRNQHALVSCMARLELKIDAQNIWMYEAKGGLRFGKWVAGIGLTGLGILVAWMKFFKGGL